MWSEGVGSAGWTIEVAYVSNYVSNAREGGKGFGRWGGSVGRWVSARRLRGQYVGTGIVS